MVFGRCLVRGLVGWFVGRQERASEHISMNIHCAQKNLSCKFVFIERDRAASDFCSIFCFAESETKKKEMKEITY